MEVKVHDIFRFFINVGLIVYDFKYLFIIFFLLPVGICLACEHFLFSYGLFNLNRYFIFEKPLSV